MANARGKEIDTTHLPGKNYIERQILHRDILAHHLRWTHVAKYVRQSQRWKSLKVLDVGCGVDVPLARMFRSNRTQVAQYVGIEYSKASKFEELNWGPMPVSLHGGVDFAKDVTVVPKGTHLQGGYKVQEEYYDAPGVITCFEVLEHVEPGHARRMLEKMRDVLLVARRQGKEAVAFVSTPCYDERVGEAGNHVSEIRRDALGAVIEDLGFCVEGNWGTFASIRDYRDEFFFAEFGDAGRKIWERLTEYYDSNYLATIFAPMYPAGSRNNIWRIRPVLEDEAWQRQFKNLEDIPAPWTSSDRWRELDGKGDAA